MSNQLYPSDLTDRAWEYIKRLIPAAKSGGRKRQTDMRLTINAIFYINRTGCHWRYLPREYPPWQTVYGYFRAWRITGVWERIHDHLRDLAREQRRGVNGNRRRRSLTARRSRPRIVAALSAGLTPASKSLGVNDISWSTHSVCCCWSWFIRQGHKTAMERELSWRH